MPKDDGKTINPPKPIKVWEGPLYKTPPMPPLTVPADPDEPNKKFPIWGPDGKPKR